MPSLASNANIFRSAESAAREMRSCFIANRRAVDSCNTSMTTDVAPGWSVRI
jgi:hypothetical protein